MKGLLVIVMLMTACADGGSTKPPATERVAVRIQPAAAPVVEIQAEVADEPAEWIRGLMFRRSLADDAGMLFVFEKRRTHDFWMKDTRIPLDLVSIREGRVVAVQRLEPCRSASCPTTTTQTIDAALEINAGKAERAGIVAGALVEAEDLI